jgi:UDP-N-acetylmuramoyl-L-alanyl-D-glutamate--2,6-diaminopimelate ligase
MSEPTRRPRGKTLAELERSLEAAGARLFGPSGASSLLVRDVVQDSRRAGPEALFVVRAGHATSGAGYIEEARRRGAVALLTSPGVTAEEPRLEVEDLALGWALAAHEVFETPSRSLTVVGITGTNGKTTVACLVEQALRALGARPARLGTLGFFLGDEKRAETLTTPQADDMARYLFEAVQAGASHAVLEVSSHALDQGRVLGVHFEVAAFTNLSQDHLDYHGTLEAYAAAKRKLLDEHRPKRRVINVADTWGARFSEELFGGRSFAEGGPDLRVDPTARGTSQVRAADVVVEQATHSAAGVRARVLVSGEPVELRSRLVGEHNLENLVVALGCLVACGFPSAAAAAALGEATGAPGRLERCDEPGDEVIVLVDYAHTPDALERCLRAVRSLGSRVTCLFGCGGDRDRSKRPLMGAAAVRHAERVVVTNDNPRTEDPDRILDDIRPGLSAAQDTEVVVERDRARAIHRAILEAAPGEVVVLAGKGHETYQILGDRVIDFDDRVIARQALAARRDPAARSGSQEVAS